MTGTTVYRQLGVMDDSSLLPHFLLESGECRHGFEESVIDFHVNVYFSLSGH